MTSVFGTLITHLQLFGIGFTFGLAGPCLLVCTPAVLIYITGTKRKWSGALGAIFTFLSGRIIAYVVLGYVAGLSAILLRHFTGSGVAAFLKPLGGVVGIIMGILVLTYNEPEACRHRSAYDKASNFGSLFAFGFLIGITPCAPLLLLLSEIILISRSSAQGAAYALSFGLGTSLSGLLVLGLLGNAAARLHSYILTRNAGKKILKITCALLLALLGITMILS